MKSKLSRFAVPYVVWMAIFVVAPIVIMVVYAFAGSEGGFTLDNFVQMGGYAAVFGRSFKLALIATAICLLLGYPVAYLLSREGERFRRRHAAIGVQRFLRALERLCERLQQRPIHGHLPRIGTRVGVGHKHVHMASFQRAGIDSGTKHVLQKHQIFGHPEGKVQKTVVDGFELDGDLTPVAAGARATIARHALHGTARLLASFVTLIITFP